jgi:hypothetical protein
MRQGKGASDMRALTVEEKDAIRIVKQRVNAVVKRERKALTQQLKEEMRGRRGVRSDRARKLEKDRDSLKPMTPMTGDPVHLKMGDSQILIDYKVVQRAMRLTQRFQRKIFFRNDLLVIEYAGKSNKGFIELYQLQGHEGLENLPTVEIVV